MFFNVYPITLLGPVSEYFYSLKNFFKRIMIFTALLLRPQPKILVPEKALENYSFSHLVVLAFFREV